MTNISNDTELSRDWDIESYRTDHESDEHWSLRRDFMIEHQDTIPEQELVCLAQVFTNVELLGCRYPLKTMKKISNLSKNVADSYRNSRKDKLKRTFVEASDAAEQKAKRTANYTTTTS